MTKHLTIVLKEMCKRVGADFDSIDFKSDDTKGSELWFHLYEWNLKEEYDFNRWFYKYLSSNTEAREELMEQPSKNARILDGFVNMFVFTYGWAYSKDVTN